VRKLESNGVFLWTAVPPADGFGWKTPTGNLQKRGNESHSQMKDDEKLLGSRQSIYHINTFRHLNLYSFAS